MNSKATDASTYIDRTYHGIQTLLDETYGPNAHRDKGDCISEIRTLLWELRRQAMYEAANKASEVLNYLGNHVDLKYLESEG